MDAFWVEAMVSRQFNFDGDDLTEDWQRNRAGFAAHATSSPFRLMFSVCIALRTQTARACDITSQLDFNSRVFTPVDGFHRLVRHCKSNALMNLRHNIVNGLQAVFPKVIRNANLLGNSLKIIAE